MRLSTHLTFLFDVEYSADGEIELESVTHNLPPNVLPLLSPDERALLIAECRANARFEASASEVSHRLACRDAGE